MAKKRGEFLVRSGKEYLPPPGRSYLMQIVKKRQCVQVIDVRNWITVA